jgi:hypothetical protein
MRKIFLFIAAILTLATVACAQGKVFINADGTLKNFWQISKDGAKIRWNPDSLNYKFVYRTPSSALDSAEVMLAKDPRGANTYQKIYGKKDFSNIYVDTLLLVNKAGETLSEGQLSYATLGLGESAPIYGYALSYTDTMTSRRYMRTSGESKYLTGLKPNTPADTGKVLVYGSGGAWSLRTLAATHAAVTESITGIDLTGQALSLTTGYSIPQDTSIANWRTAYAMRHAAITETVTGLSLTGQALSLTAGYVIPTTTQETNWGAAYTHSTSAHQTIINGTGFVKASGTSLSYDNSTYLTANQTITLGGILSGSGTTSISASAASGYYMPSTTDQTNWNAKAIAPASNTADNIPLWNGANSKTLKDGLAYNSAAVVSTIVGRNASARSDFYTVGLGNAAGQYGEIIIYGSAGKYLSLTAPITGTDKLIDFPNASGTVALTSDLTSKVIAPASNTADNIPLWNGANSKTLKDGLAYTSAATISTIVGRDGSAHSAFNSITLGTSTQYGQLTIYGTTYNTLFTTNAASSNKWVQFPNSDGDVPLLQTANNWTGINEFRSDLKFTDDLVNVWEAGTVSGDTLYTTGKTSMTTDYDGDIRVIAGGVDGKEILLMSISVVTSLVETGNIVNLPSGSVGFNQYGIARFKYYATAGKWVCIGVENN